MLSANRVLCAGCGFVITKLDIFPAVAARGAGQILLVSLFSDLSSMS